MRRLRELCTAIAALAFLVHGRAQADTLEPGEPADLFTLTPAVTGLTLPTSFAFLPDARLIITQKQGQVLLAEADGQTRNIGSFTVDSRSEKGLLNVILHPDFASNRLLIFYYSANDSIGGTNIDRNRVVTVPLDASDQLDLSAETVLVRGIRGPANHDGGAMGIGPDGKLYVGVGDTGCNAGVPAEPPYTPANFFATCLTNPNGKILRVNVDGSIPNDNPLVGKTVTACGNSCRDDVTIRPTAAAREEIWAWGFRNPWRFSFDPRTGNLWVGDVGQVSNEEIDVIAPTGGGKHYGWPWREGGEGHPVTQCEGIQPASGACVEPAYYCRHGAAQGGIDGNCQAITGGVIVDSCQFPASFRGRYFFGDNAADWIATLDPTTNRSGIIAGSRKIIAQTTAAPVHFGTGPDGALYYAVIGGPGASIQRLFPKTPATCPPPAGTGGAPGGGGTSGGGGSTDASAEGGAASGRGGRSSGGGSTGLGGASGGDGGSDGDARVDASLDAGGNTSARSEDDSSCGCRLVTANGAPASRLVSALAVALTALGRRRSRFLGRPLRFGAQ